MNTLCATQMVVYDTVCKKVTVTLQLCTIVKYRLSICVPSHNPPNQASNERQRKDGWNLRRAQSSRTAILLNEGLANPEP